MIHHSFAARKLVRANGTVLCRLEQVVLWGTDAQNLFGAPLFRHEARGVEPSMWKKGIPLACNERPRKPFPDFCAVWSYATKHDR